MSKTIRVLWSEADNASVTIKGANGVASPNFTVNGSAITFPYTLSASTSFVTKIADTYTVSVNYFGREIANTPDGVRKVDLTQDGELVFAPSPDTGNGGGSTDAGTVLSTVESNIKDSTTPIGSALFAAYVPKGHSDVNGTQSGPLVEIGNQSSQATFHLLAGVGATAPYIIGIGVDHDNSPTGIVTSVKGNGSIGMGPTLESTSGAASIGLLAQTFGPGKLIRAVAGSTATGPIVDLDNSFGGSGNILQWETTSGNTAGQIGAAGNVTMTGPAGFLAIQHATTNQNQIKMSVATAAAALTFYQWTGSANLWFPSVIATNSNSLRFRQGGAAAMGAETVSTLIEMKNGNSLGFFGVTPVTRPAAIASPTADVNALKTAVDAIRAALTSLGLTS